MDDIYNKLNIIWAFDNPGTFKYIITPLIVDALKRPGKYAQLTLLGATTKLVAEQEKVQDDLRKLIEQGLTVVACKESVELHKVHEKLEALGGIEIKQLAKRALDDSSGPDEKIMML